jgi:hypothetical protein
MPSTFLACRDAMTRFYDKFLGKAAVKTTHFKPAASEVQPDEARRRRRNDTDGSLRRAAETKLRHEMH